MGRGHRGDVAQLGERCVRIAEVRGSSPLISTTPPSPSIAVDGTTEDDVLAVAAAVEADSEHPLARAIVTGAQARLVDVPPGRDFEALAGRGARASVDGRTAQVGGPRLLRELELDVDPSLAVRTGSWAADGRTVLHVIADGRMLGALAVEDEIRPESYQAVQQLHAAGVRVAMTTGDSQAVADAVARRLGVDDVAAQVLPADKTAAVARFQEGGQRVAMVGDGVNDAPALAQADVGIAIGAGTDVAVESAGIVLVRDDPRDVVGAIELSRATYRKMAENLVWATAYNVVAIPLAAGVLAPWGLVMPMALGAVLMSASTIIVAANAQRLRRLKLRPDDVPKSAPWRPRCGARGGLMASAIVAVGHSVRRRHVSATGDNLWPRCGAHPSP